VFVCHDHADVIDRHYSVYRAIQDMCDEFDVASAIWARERGIITDGTDGNSETILPLQSAQCGSSCFYFIGPVVVDFVLRHMWPSRHMWPGGWVLVGYS